MATITIKDVAREAGLAVTTVSRVMNNRGYISKETRKKVTKAIAELNYQPNAIARALVQKQNACIGLIVPIIQHPFFASCIHYIEQYVSEAGYKLMLCNSQWDKEKEKDYIKMLRSNQVAGIIVCTRSGAIDDCCYSLPVVTLERSFSPRIPAILCDNYEGGWLAMKCLLRKGCHHIAFIGGSKDVRLPADARNQAYLDACNQAGMEPVLYLGNEQSFNNRDYMANIENLLKDHPETDGIFASSDNIGASVLQTCLERGMHIPEQMKIIGFGDFEISRLIFPQLTTIRQPIDGMCKQAVTTLIDKINRNDVPKMSVLSVTLIERSTT